MKPLHAVLALTLIISASAVPEITEDAKELPQSAQPVVEAEESEPQTRKERCTTCSGSLNLAIPSLPEIAAIPGAEVHTQQSYEECDSAKGCAGLKLKDGTVVEKYGNINANLQRFGGLTPDLSQNPFLNGKVNLADGKSFSKFEKSSFSTSSKSGELNLPLGVQFGQEGFGQAGFGQGQAGFGQGQGGFSSQSSYSAQSSNFGQGGNGGGFGAGFQAGNGYTGSSPAPFAGGSNVNLIQSGQKGGYDQSQQSIDAAFQATGNVVSQHSGGELQQTCAGQGYVCVPKAQCNNGVVNSNGAAILQAKTQKQYCNTRNEICCRIEVSGGGIQGGLGVGSATFQGSQSSIFSQGNFGAQGSQGSANGFQGSQGSASGSQGSASGFQGSQGSASGSQGSASGFQAIANGFQASQGNQNAFQASQGNQNAFQGAQNGFQGNQGAGFGSKTSQSSFESSFNSNGNANTFGNGAAGFEGSFKKTQGFSGVATTPTRFAGSNEVYKSSSSSFDSSSAGSDFAGVSRPFSGPGLKPGIPYLPPDAATQATFVSSTYVPTTARPTPRPSTQAPGYLPPQIQDSPSNQQNVVVPPTYTDGNLILDANRPGNRPVIPSEIPSGCAAALKCTPIEYCTAEGVMSNTTVVLTRDQEAFRVPLTDCKILESGQIGKCCRDPFYTDPWPATQIGKWVPGVFGGNDGKYTPPVSTGRINEPAFRPDGGKFGGNSHFSAHGTQNLFTSGTQNKFNSASHGKSSFGQGQFASRGQGVGVTQFSGSGTQSQFGASGTKFGTGQSQFGAGQGTAGQFGANGLGVQGRFGANGIGVQTQFSESSSNQFSGSRGGQFGGTGQSGNGIGGQATFGAGGSRTQFSESGTSQSRFGAGSGSGNGAGQSQFGAGGGRTQFSESESVQTRFGSGTGTNSGNGIGGQSQFGAGAGRTQFSESETVQTRFGTGSGTSRGNGAGQSQFGAGGGRTQFSESETVQTRFGTGSGTTGGNGAGQSQFGASGTGQSQFGASGGRTQFSESGIGVQAQFGSGTQATGSGIGGQTQFGAGGGQTTFSESETVQSRFNSGSKASGIGGQSQFGASGVGAQGQFGGAGQTGSGVGQTQFGASGGRTQFTESETVQSQSRFGAGGQSSGAGSQAAGGGIGIGIQFGGVGQGQGLGGGSQFGEVDRTFTETESQFSSTESKFGGGNQFGAAGGAQFGGAGGSQFNGAAAGNQFGGTAGGGAGGGQFGAGGASQFSSSESQFSTRSQGQNPAASGGQFGAGGTQSQFASESSQFASNSGQGGGQGQFAVGLGAQGGGGGQNQFSRSGQSQFSSASEGQFGGGGEIQSGVQGLLSAGQALLGVGGQGFSLGIGGGVTDQARLSSNEQYKKITEFDTVKTNERYDKAGVTQNKETGVVNRVITTVEEGQDKLIRKTYEDLQLIRGKIELYRYFLQQITGYGDCGIMNGQKPYGNRNDLEVDFAEIPWQAMVLLQTNRSLLCGGVITRPDVVLTSASCVEGLSAKNVLIKGGEWKLGIDDEPLPFQIVQVKHILRHPFYKAGSLKNDIAILVLNENLRWSKNIYPICLPGEGETLDAFYNGAGECIVTGWGKQVLQAHLEGAIMHSINVSLINPGECEAKLSQDYPHLLEQYDQSSCACGQPLNPVNNMCKVDVGSALACTTDNVHYVLRGIYSWDSGCQTGNQLAAFFNFDLEWYYWAIGLRESQRFLQYSGITNTNQVRNQFSQQYVQGSQNGGNQVSNQFSQQYVQGTQNGGANGGFKKIVTETIKTGSGPITTQFAGGNGFTKTITKTVEGTGQFNGGIGNGNQFNQQFVQGAQNGGANGGFKKIVTETIKTGSVPITTQFTGGNGFTKTITKTVEGTGQFNGGLGNAGFTKQIGSGGQFVKQTEYKTSTIGGTVPITGKVTGTGFDQITKSNTIKQIATAGGNGGFNGEYDASKVTGGQAGFTQTGGVTQFNGGKTVEKVITTTVQGSGPISGQYSVGGIKGFNQFGNGQSGVSGKIIKETVTTTTTGSGSIPVQFTNGGAKGFSQFSATGQTGASGAFNQFGSGGGAVSGGTTKETIITTTTSGQGPVQFTGPFTAGGAKGFTQFTAGQSGSGGFNQFGNGKIIKETVTTTTTGGGQFPGQFGQLTKLNGNFGNQYSTTGNVQFTGIPAIQSGRIVTETKKTSGAIPFDFSQFSQNLKGAGGVGGAAGVKTISYFDKQVIEQPVQIIKGPVRTEEFIIQGKPKTTTYTQQFITAGSNGESTNLNPVAVLTPGEHKHTGRCPCLDKGK